MKKLLMIITMLFMLSTTAFAAHVEYTSMNVPTNVNTSWKTWMSYTAISSRSTQGKFISKWGFCDSQGFMRCAGERDFGVPEDYYLVAMGSYYGTAIGSKFRITTNTGNVFYVALGDCKADIHTNSTHQYTTRHKDVIEFIVNTKTLNREVKRAGNANVYMPLNGSIAKIEKMTFIY